MARKASKMMGAKNNLASFFKGMPLDEMRKKARKRPKKDDKRPLWAVIVASVVGVVLALWTVMTVVELVDEPSNPAWWALLWVFGIPAFGVIGYVTKMTPMGPTAQGALAIVYVFGFFVVPYGVATITDFNIVALILAVIAAIPLTVALNHYSRYLTLYREGYQV